jgi:hypothetical protein
MPNSIASGAQGPRQYQQFYANCLLGSHILHYHGYPQLYSSVGRKTDDMASILDAYGHLSFRHPAKPDVFVMPRNMAPASITSVQDLLDYKVSDASATDPNPPRGYIERYIHSEIYKRFPDVNSVIHSHASDVVPYTISGKLL